MPTLRPPALTEYDLGPRAWSFLLQLAALRGRRPEQQWNQLAKRALVDAMDGDDVELTRAQLEALSADDELVA